MTRVAIIGTGVAGLQTARALKKCGLKIVLLEQALEVGGVWRSNYAGYGLQVPAALFTFPEFPYPPDIAPSSYPSGPTIRKYIQAYAEHFDLTRHVMFGCKVVRIEQKTNCSWDLYYQDCNKSGKLYKLSADFLVMCTGALADPYIPTIEGADKFKGTVLHASEFTDSAVASDKHVVVVGAGKSAVDTAVNIAFREQTKSVTLSFRQAHWPWPRQCNKDALSWALFTRKFMAMLPPYYTATAWDYFKSTLLKPFQRLYWSQMESKITKHYGLSGDLVPELPLLKDMFYGGLVHDGEWYKAIHDEKVAIAKGEIQRYEPHAVVLKNGLRIPADIVIFGTGYVRKYDVFDPETRRKLQIGNDGVYLYRNMLPPYVKNLAFIGSEALTLNNVLTAALQSEWLRRAVSGQFSVPDIEVMCADIARQKEWKRKLMPPQLQRAGLILMYTQHYHDQLMRDMQQNPYRKRLLASKCLPFADCTQPYAAADYQDLFLGPRQCMPRHSSLLYSPASKQATKNLSRAVSGLTDLSSKSALTRQATVCTVPDASAASASNPEGSTARAGQEGSPQHSAGLSRNPPGTQANETSNSTGNIFVASLSNLQALTDTLEPSERQGSVTYPSGSSTNAASTAQHQRQTGGVMSQGDSGVEDGPSRPQLLPISLSRASSSLSSAYIVPIKTVAAVGGSERISSEQVAVGGEGSWNDKLQQLTRGVLDWHSSSLELDIGTGSFVNLKGRRSHQHHQSRPNSHAAQSKLVNHLSLKQIHGSREADVGSKLKIPRNSAGAELAGTRPMLTNKPVENEPSGLETLPQLTNQQLCDNSSTDDEVGTVAKVQEVEIRLPPCSIPSTRVEPAELLDTQPVTSLDVVEVACDVFSSIQLQMLDLDEPAPSYHQQQHEQVRNRRSSLCLTPTTPHSMSREKSQRRNSIAAFDSPSTGTLNSLAA